MEIVALAFFVLSVIMTFMFIDQYYEARRWRKMERDSAKIIYSLRMEVENLPRRPMETVSAEIARKITELQNENAALKTDCETGCRTIETMRRKLNEETALLNRITGENRALLAQLRARKR